MKVLAFLFILIVSLLTPNIKGQDVTQDPMAQAWIGAENDIKYSGEDPLILISLKADPYQEEIDKLAEISRRFVQVYRRDSYDYMGMNEFDNSVFSQLPKWIVLKAMNLDKDPWGKATNPEHWRDNRREPGDIFSENQAKALAFIYFLAPKLGEEGNNREGKKVISLDPNWSETLGYDPTRLLVRTSGSLDTRRGTRSTKSKDWGWKIGNLEFMVIPGWGIKDGKLVIVNKKLIRKSQYLEGLMKWGVETLYVPLCKIVDGKIVHPMEKELKARALELFPPVSALILAEASTELPSSNDSTSATIPVTEDLLNGPDQESKAEVSSTETESVSRLAKTADEAVEQRKTIENEEEEKEVDWIQLLIVLGVIAALFAVIVLIVTIKKRNNLQHNPHACPPSSSDLPR